MIYFYFAQFPIVVSYKIADRFIIEFISHNEYVRCRIGKRNIRRVDIVLNDKLPVQYQRVSADYAANKEITNRL